MPAAGRNTSSTIAPAAIPTLGGRVMTTVRTSTAAWATGATGAPATLKVTFTGAITGGTVVPSGKVTVINPPGGTTAGAIYRMVYAPTAPAVRGTTVTSAVPVAAAGAAITAVRLATRARMVSTLSIRCFVFI
ncbi:MAG: hypothetical protein DDT32_01833 [Syntrophomonadaceae bacterium]|nr:hypothetical protein [Bacillota bacterium]